MRQFTHGIMDELLADHQSPCVSLYQPTHRHHAHFAQDAIRFRNLVGEIDWSLRQRFRGREVTALLAHLRSYERDTDFWDHQLDGLAFFVSPDSFRMVQFQRPVPEMAVVANSFHVKPLIRIMQSADRYQVLCLGRGNVSLYEGSRDSLDEVELQNVPRSVVEALGDELTEPHLTVASYNGAAGPAMHHGHGGKSDEDEIDIVRYIRAVDRAVWENHSRPSGLPLMLAALPQYHAVFRHVSHNPRLMDHGLDLHADPLDVERLRDEAWRAFEPQYLARVGAALDRYQVARSRAAGSDDLSELCEAATFGRIASLLVDADLHIGGKVDPVTGRVEFGKLSDPDCDDLLDDVAERVLRTGGEVFALPRDQMPSMSGAAGVFRFGRFRFSL